MPDSSPGSIPARDPSVPLPNPQPTVLGQPRAVVRSSDDPTPPTLEETDAGGLVLPALPLSLSGRGEGVQDGVTAARMMPLPLRCLEPGPRAAPTRVCVQTRTRGLMD